MRYTQIVYCQSTLFFTHHHQRGSSAPGFTDTGQLLEAGQAGPKNTSILMAPTARFHQHTMKSMVLLIKTPVYVLLIDLFIS